MQLEPLFKYYVYESKNPKQVLKVQNMKQMLKKVWALRKGSTCTNGSKI